MKLQPPLSSLVDRCQTVCVAECCGIGAYDFSPVQIASYLTMSRGVADSAELAAIEEQIADLRANYGSAGASGAGVEIQEMNQSFTAEEVDNFTKEISANLKVALDLIAESEIRRFRRNA